MEKAQREFVDRMGAASESDGLAPIAGRLFAILLLADAPRSLDDLAAAIGVSKASVSTDARRLLERGIVERITHAGDRRDYYALAPDFFARIVRARADRWQRMHTLADDLVAQAADLSPAARKRIDALGDIQAFVIDRLERALTDWARQSRKTTATGTRRRRRPATRS